MKKLLKETAIAGTIYFAISWSFGFGIDEGQGGPEAAMSALVFAGLYFAVGLAINWFKRRNS